MIRFPGNLPLAARLRVMTLCGLVLALLALATLYLAGNFLRILKDPGVDTTKLDGVRP